MRPVGSGVLGVWHGVAEGHQQAVDDWYNKEHHPERVAVPGFLRARRYVNEGSGPRYFSRYDVSEPEVLGGAPYLAALNNPSVWSQRIFPHYRGTVRGTFGVLHRRGTADGGAIVTLRFAGGAKPLTHEFGRALADAAADITEAMGVLTVEVWQADQSISGLRTQEQALRSAGEGSPDFALVIDANTCEAAISGLQARAPAGLLSAAKLDQMRLVYQLIG